MDPVERANWKKGRDERGACFINASDTRTEIFDYIEAHEPELISFFDEPMMA